MSLSEKLRRAFGGTIDSARSPVEPVSEADVPAMGAVGFEDYAHEGVPWSPSVNWSGSLADVATEGVLDAAWVYRKQIAVRICVNFLAKNVSQLRLKAHERDGDNGKAPVAPEHPLQRVLDRPNSRMTGLDLIYATVADLALYENAYWLKAQGSSGLQLYRLPPAYVTVKGGSILTGPDAYEVDMRNGRPPKVFGPQDVVHFHGYSPLDTRVGESVLHPLATVLREEFEASRWRAKFWHKGARMDGVLERPADASPWTDGAIKRFREGWRRFARGGDVEGETAILEDGMQYKPIAFSPKDAEFIAGREWALDITATAYDIPLAMLSRSDSQAFASMKEFHKILYVDVLGPKCAQIEKTIWLQLVPDFDGDSLFVEFNIDEKLQGDFEQQANAARQSVQVPWQSVNDMRAKRGEPPIGDPNDEQNPYNWPARPKNYSYGDPAEQMVEPVQAPPQAPTLVPDTVPAAANGHAPTMALEAMDG